MGDPLKYFLDTEFIETPLDQNPTLRTRSGMTLHLVSLALVAEDGREFYAEMQEIPWEEAHPWVVENVQPKLLGGFSRRRRSDVANGIMQLLGNDREAEIWAYYAAYDWVSFCSVFGRMSAAPPRVPMFCWDFKQTLEEAGRPDPPWWAVAGREAEHNALADARWLRVVHAWLEHHKAEGCTRHYHIDEEGRCST